MLKIAIISDIHGNLEALKATINDIEKRKIDKVICLGDIIAKGVHSKQCVDLIKEKCDVVLQGNCDEYFSKTYENINYMPEQEQNRIKWNQSLITNDDRKYLLNLPFCYEFYMSGSLVRLFHAGPKVNDMKIINADSFETKYQMFLPTIKTVTQNVADVVIYGHIHHPYMDKLYNKTLINVGSVGNSYDVIRVPYNIDKELQDEDLNIEKENYRFELKKGIYRDMTRVNEHFKNLGIDVGKI